MQFIPIFLRILLCFNTSRFATSQFSFHRIRCADDQYEYTDPSSNTECRQCSACPPGYGVARLCSHYNDTVCHPCARGTYSSSTSRWSSCLTCRSCAVHQLQRTACSSTRDRDCERSCRPGYYFDNMLNLCRHCNYCYQDNGVAVRIPECRVPGIPDDYQCMIIRSRLPVNNQHVWWFRDRGTTEPIDVEPTEKLKTTQPTLPSHILTNKMVTTTRCSSLQMHTDVSNHVSDDHQQTPEIEVQKIHTKKLIWANKAGVIGITIFIVVTIFLVSLIFICCKYYGKTNAVTNGISEAKEARYSKIKDHQTTCVECFSIKDTLLNLGKIFQNNATDPRHTRSVSAVV